MEKPIDFIDNQDVIDTVNINFDTFSPEKADSGDYIKDRDEKWMKFCREHNLSQKERHHPKWHELYLVMCSEGMID